jgi:hypothetical protein
MCPNNSYPIDLNAPGRNGVEINTTGSDAWAAARPVGRAAECVTVDRSRYVFDRIIRINPIIPVAIGSRLGPYEITSRRRIERNLKHAPYDPAPWTSCPARECKPCSIATGSVADKAAILKQRQEAVAAWNKHDAQALAAHFAGDVDRVRNNGV